MSLYTDVIQKADKNIHTLLESHLDAETKMYFLKQSMNNLAKKVYSEIARGIESQRGKPSRGARQAFETEKGIYGFCVTADMNNANCRQFYSDYSGFYCLSMVTGQVYVARSKVVNNPAFATQNTGNQNNDAISLSIPFDELDTIPFEQLQQEIHASYAANVN